MLVWGRGGGGPGKPGAMSLFHDFKLKRRKVDSRGSSDGEYSLHLIYKEIYSKKKPYFPKRSHYFAFSFLSFAFSFPLSLFAALRRFNFFCFLYFQGGRGRGD